MSRSDISIVDVTNRLEQKKPQYPKKIETYDNLK